MLGLKLGTVDYEVALVADHAGRMTAVIDEIPLNSPPIEGEIILWGVPADHGVPGPRVPLLSAPTECGEDVVATLRAFSYEGRSDARSFADAPRTGCDAVPFAPEAELETRSSVAGASSGLQLTLRNPTTEDPDGPAAAQLREARLELPPGFAVSPAAANGLGACTAAQFDADSDAPVACPPSAKVGEVIVHTPMLDEPLRGPVYVAAQEDNPFGSLFALYLAPAGSGVELKIAGRVELDPDDGRPAIVLSDLPRQLFTELEVTLNHGPRALLTLPRRCGTHLATAELRSWARSGNPVALSDTVRVDGGCEAAGRFGPRLRAGTLEPRAGTPSPLILRLTREDAGPNLERLRATLPAGMVARPASVPLCSGADLARLSCSDASAIGTLTLGVGAGSAALFLPAAGEPAVPLHLAGPYRGAPYSVFAAVPARAGPFDLGTVGLRSTLEVDPASARVTLATDPLPQILRGVPIPYRDVRIEIDRPGFILNPTSCVPLETAATATSAAGEALRLADPFRAGSCGALRFRPRVALRAEGRTHRSAHPRLRVAFGLRPGGANVRRARLVLPRAFFVDHTRVRAVCSREEYAARACPRASAHGWARVWTPLLDQPLRGPVYLRESDRMLPDLALALDGQLRLDLVAAIDSARGRLSGTFAGVPDAPLTRLELNLRGGRGGLLVNNTELCRRPLRANLRLVAHNGRTATLRPALGVECERRASPRVRRRQG